MAGSSRTRIDHIHAHGTATQVNDISEYNGFKAVFGDDLKHIPVTSTKSMTGHTFGGAGALAAVFSILTIENSIIPSTLNHSTKDELFKDLYVVTAPLHQPVQRMLSVALGFGGEVAAIVFEKIEKERKNN